MRAYSNIAELEQFQFIAKGPFIVIGYTSMGVGLMVKWIRGKWRYTLTTDGLMALIQIDNTGGLDPEEVLYPYDCPKPIISREFGIDENMQLELLKITGFNKAALKKRGFEDCQFNPWSGDFEVPDEEGYEFNDKSDG